MQHTQINTTTRIIDFLRPHFQGRARFAYAWIFTAALIIITDSPPNIVGAGICFFGAMIRFVSGGFLRKEAALSVGGPYMFTRNPLYFGTLIMGIGAFVAVDAYILGVLMAIWFTVNYGFVIEHEEEKLPRYFGDPYLKYKTLVPRFFPSIRPVLFNKKKFLEINPDPVIYRFSFSLAMKNKAYEAIVSFVGIMLGLYGIAMLRTWLSI